MAQIKLSPGLQQLSGATFRGSQVVVYPVRNRTFARRQRGTPWRNTPAQVKVTQYNKAATSAFRNLTDEQRATWKAYATNFIKVHMGVPCDNTDLEMFISTNFHRQLNEEAISMVAPVTQPTPFSFAVSEAHILNSAPSLSIKFSHSSTDYDNSWLLLRASHSFPSAQRRARLCDYRMAGSVEHYTLFPVQPSPQICFVPLTPLKHTQNFYVWIAAMLLSQDYYKGTQIQSQVQLQLQDCIWHFNSVNSITPNPALGAIDFKISDVLVARLFQNGNFSLKGELCEYTPSEATSSYDYIHFDNATSQIRLAYKTKTTPGFKTILTVDSDGNSNLYGELYEFMDLSPYSESLYFHPYCNPRKLQLSVDRTTAALIYLVDDSPQNALLLREVTENVL